MHAFLLLRRRPKLRCSPLCSSRLLPLSVLLSLRRLVRSAPCLHPSDELYFLSALQNPTSHCFPLFLRGRDFAFSVLFISSPLSLPPREQSSWLHPPARAVRVSSFPSAARIMPHFFFFSHFLRGRCSTEPCLCVSHSFVAVRDIPHSSVAAAVVVALAPAPVAKSFSGCPGAFL